MTPLPRLLTTGEAAHRLGVHIGTVRRWAKSGQLPHSVMPSGRLRFHPDEIDAAVERVEKSA